MGHRKKKQKTHTQMKTLEVAWIEIENCMRKACALHDPNTQWINQTSDTNIGKTEDIKQFQVK